MIRRFGLGCGSRAISYYTSDELRATAYSMARNSHLYAEQLDLQHFTDQTVEQQFQRPPTIKHNLHRILRTKGIYTIDELIRINNGDTFLQNIGGFDREALKRLPKYRPPSKDDQLSEVGDRLGAKYITGSSSVTDAMTQIFYAMTNFRSPDVTGLTDNFDHKNLNYMSAYRKPATVMLRKQKPGVYAVDGDKGIMKQQNQELLKCGVLLEAMLTTDQQNFVNLMDLNYDLTEAEIEELIAGARSYRMRKMGNMLIRSQIDCEGVSDDGSYYVYELKTRACAPQRYDASNTHLYLDYKINSRLGSHSSFEREYFDLIRSILIKYYFQVSIGFMDGAMLCYHNTNEIFGFEYITIQEMEKRIFGNSDFGNKVLKTSNCILQVILDKVTEMYPDDVQLRVGLQAVHAKGCLLITVERFDEQFEWKESQEETPYENDAHYYMVNSPGKSAYTLNMEIHPILNGILQTEPLFLDPGDNLEFLYNLFFTGSMEFGDYMSFLQNAYKVDKLTINKDFVGIWKKMNDFHTYRKPQFQ